MLNSDDEKSQEGGAEALGHIGESGAMHAPLLAKLCKSDAPAVRLAAITALGAMHAAGAAHAGVVAKLVDDPVEAIALAAGYSLTEMGKPGAKAVAARLDGETKMKAKVACVTAFGKMGELAGEHAQLVASHLKSDDAELRTAACITLGNMGRAAQGFAELHIIALTY